MNKDGHSSGERQSAAAAGKQERKKQGMTMRKRYLLVMLIGFLLNEGLYYLSNRFHLPFWLDTTGTALAAIVLEPMAGLLVGLANNYVLALAYFSATSLFYYSASAAVALICGVLLKKDNRIKTRNIIPAILFCIIIPSVCSGLVTLWEDGGLSNSPWELYFTRQALSLGVPLWLSCIYGTLVIKIPETLIGALVVLIVYRLLPPSLRYPSVSEVYTERESRENMEILLRAEKQVEDDRKEAMKQKDREDQKAYFEKEKQKLEQAKAMLKEEKSDDKEDLTEED